MVCLMGLTHCRVGGREIPFVTKVALLAFRKSRGALSFFHYWDRHAQSTSQISVETWSVFDTGSPRSGVAL